MNLGPVQIRILVGPEKVEISDSALLKLNYNRLCAETCSFAGAGAAGGCAPFGADVDGPPAPRVGADDSLITDLCPAALVAAAGAMVGSAGDVGAGAALLKLNSFFIVEILSDQN